MAREASGDDVRDDLEDIKDDLMSLKSDVSGLLQDVVAVGKTEAGEARARLEAAIHERMSQLGDAVGKVKARGRRQVQKLEDRIVEKPLASVAIAAGVGVLVGIILGRK